MKNEINLVGQKNTHFLMQYYKQNSTKFMQFHDPPLVISLYVQRLETLATVGYCL